MRITKNKRNKINKVIQYWKLHTRYAPFLPCNIYSRVKNVIVGFIKITGSHRNSCLPPVMRNLEWWVCYSIKSYYKK